MINYADELKKLRFGFRENDIIDYKTLLALICAIKENDKMEEEKENIFQTLQVLVLVYGLDERLTEAKYSFDENNIEKNIDDINLWTYLMVLCFNKMEQSKDFYLNDETLSLIQKVLLISEGNNLSAADESVNACYDDTCPVEPNLNDCEEDLTKFNDSFLRDYIISNNLLPYKCACCGLEEWQNKTISLKLSHKNNLDNKINNLEFLCPNCYSQIGK